MRHLRLSALLAALLVVLLGLLAAVPTGAVGQPASAPPAPAYTVTTLHFKVLVGPAGDQVCDIVGDLYVPAAASRTNRVPAILTTNGFGGSKNDQAGIGTAFASRGYVVLSYSGLGFGGSSCKITLDDPDWDGKAGRQLVSYLGGSPGIAFLDAEHTQPAPPLQVVVHDPVDHRGVARRIDPRVGTVGGSYGGGFQFATAGLDARVDTLVPLITWNDLSYSLAPNNTDQVKGVSSRRSGSAKQWWAVGLSLVGLTSDLQNGQLPPDVLACPNFADFVCPALVAGGATGYLQPAHVARLRHASVASYLHRIKVPVLLVQGQNDTLFNLNEAIATYQALQAQGTEVKMIWQSWGHSGPAAPGEIDLGDPDPAAQYETGRIVDWLDHYLKDSAVGTGPEFAYFRDWVAYDGNAAPAYASSSTFPVGSGRTYRLSGTGDLVAGRATQPGSQAFLTTAAGAPTGLNTLDVLGGYVGQPVNEVTDLPGTSAAWTTPELTAPMNVVGVPVARLRVQAPTAALTQGLGETGMLTLYVKVADVAPDGTARLIRSLEAPVRIPDVTKPFTVRLPAIVHRFQAGHRIRLVVAGGSINYRGGTVPTLVTIASGPAQTLTLPVVP